MGQLVQQNCDTAKFGSTVIHETRKIKFQGNMNNNVQLYDRPQESFENQYSRPNGRQQHMAVMCENVTTYALNTLCVEYSIGGTHIHNVIVSQITCTSEVSLRLDRFCVRCYCMFDIYTLVRALITHN